MNKANKFLTKIKINAHTLKCNFQIPLSLYKAIIQLDIEDCNVERKAKYLIEATKHYCRVKGYYSENKILHAQCNMKFQKEYDHYCEVLIA